MSRRQTASACGCARSTARDVPREADENGLSWEDVAGPGESAAYEPVRVRRALSNACPRHLWMPVPQELEDLMADVATGRIAPEDVDSSPYGMLFELAVSIARERIGYGTFATT